MTSTHFYILLMELLSQRLVKPVILQLDAAKMAPKKSQIPESTRLPNTTITINRIQPRRREMTDIKSDIMPSTGYSMPVRECRNVNKRTNATSPPPHHIAWNQTFWARFPTLYFDDLMTSTILFEN